MPSVNVSDSSPATEFVLFQFSNPRVVVSDSRTATESVSIVRNPLLLSVFDSDGLTDSVSVSRSRLIRETVTTGNTTYVARIRAFNQSGLYSPWSDVVSSTPS